MNRASSKHPVRVLHIVGGMTAGGVETWLMNVLRRIDRDEYHFDFLVHTGEPCFYDDEIRSLGGRVLPCLHPRQPLAYVRNFRRILKEYGPYDVVHSHVHHFSGWTLFLARLAGVRQRIAHSHNDASLADRKGPLSRKVYLWITEGLIRMNATRGLACSRRAAASLFGRDWDKEARCQVLRYGINLEPFQDEVDRTAVRRELGIPEEAPVLGHVGRFAEQKNHEFLLNVFAHVQRQRPKAVLLLVGEGPLRPGIESKIKSLGLEQQVVLAGIRPDIPRLMKGAMDLFVFPSHYEGLGLVMVEAQAAGLPCLISDTVPRDGVVDKELTRFLSLTEGAPAWADCAVRALDQRVDGHGGAGTAALSRFGIKENVRRLEEIYSL